MCLNIYIYIYIYILIYTEAFLIPQVLSELLVGSSHGSRSPSWPSVAAVVHRACR